MADLAKSAVTVLDSWFDGGLASKKYIARRVRLNLTGQGGTTNKIPASVFDMAKIVDVSSAISQATDELISCAAAYDQSYLVFGDGASNAPADQTGLFDLVVRGTRTI